MKTIENTQTAATVATRKTSATKAAKVQAYADNNGLPPAAEATQAERLEKLPVNTPLRVAEFIVSERWVQVTMTIRKDHFPNFRPEADPTRAISFLVSGRMVSLSIYAKVARKEGRKPTGLYDISIDAGKWGYNRIGTLNLKHSTEIAFQVKDRDWRRFMEDCQFIGHPPEAVIRGAFGSRSRGEGMPGHRHH